MNRIPSTTTHATDWWLLVAFATAAAVIVVSWLMPSAPIPAPTPPQATSAPASDQAELGPLAEAIVIPADGAGSESTEVAGASIAAYER